MAAVNSQIEFGKFYWDDTRRLYFRLSQKAKETASPDQKTRYETLVHAYNENWQLIGETNFKPVDSKLYDYFFKDGKLWSYVNVDDELGFAVFTFDFN
jgi:hypothetical protein